MKRKKMTWKRLIKKLVEFVWATFVFGGLGTLFLNIVLTNSHLATIPYSSGFAVVMFIFTICDLKYYIEKEHNDGT